jgi:Family of unknown function (DUF6113)
VSLLRHAACLLLGGVVGLASLLVHRDAFPLGLLLAVGTTLALSWWLVRSTHPRAGASYSLGWLAVLALAVVGRPEGDFVVATDVAGYALLGCALAEVAAGVVSLAVSGAPRP